MLQQQMNMNHLAAVDIQKINKEDLIDVSGAAFDNSVPNQHRAAKVLQTTGSPYCFRVGGLCVRLEFLEDAPPLQDVFSSFLQRKKSGL